MKTRLPIILAVCLSLLAAGAGRLLAERTRESLARESVVLAADVRRGTLGQLNSFALGLLLGGLRGPLVMALWSSTEGQRTARELEDFDTRVELIRLLQPQFDSVHLYQIWNKAYNVSVEMASLAARYAAILDAVEYGRRVIADRPANIDIETQLGEVYNNKLGGSQERDYYRLRIHEETQADQPVVKISFPTGREAEFREASRRAGVSPRRLQVRRTEDPRSLVAAVRLDVAERLRQSFEGEGVEYRQMPVRRTEAQGVASPQRMPPMLDESGFLLPEFIAPRRRPAGNPEPGTYLDGSPAQHLGRFQPFPEGISPHALAYNHYANARVLQEHAGQRHSYQTEASIQVNPARALRDWAVASYEEGRLLEAEAFGRDVDAPGDSGARQAAVEREMASVAPDAEPVSRELLEQALQRYQRSLEVGEMALEWLEGHVEANPTAGSIFESSMDRLRFLQSLLAGDAIYLELVLGQVQDREAARRQAMAHYMEAHRQVADFILRHHTPSELMPGEMQAEERLSQPIWVKWELLEIMRRERDARGPAFDHAHRIDEAEGYFDRIVQRLGHLRSAGNS